MKRIIQTTYRYRLQPTVTQERHLLQFAGARRWVWNWALAKRIAHYQTTQQQLSYNDLSAALTQLKQQPETAWLRAMESQSLQQTLRDLDAAYTRFFRRAKQQRGKVGFPRFKSKHRNTPRFRIPQRVTLAGRFVSVPKIGKIRAIVHRLVEGVTKSATFVREPDGVWFVAFVVVQTVSVPQTRPIRTSVGVDIGLKSLAVLSTGETIPNPRYYRTQLRKLKRAQQSLCRKQKGSCNRIKARLAVAKRHTKVRNQRKDCLHKLSRRLVRDFDLVTIEDIAVQGLARTKLALSVLDAGWGMFRSFLTYKAERNGTQLVIVDRFFPSSKRCSGCGSRHPALTLNDRAWTCTSCGTHHDRDLNAARNLDQEGRRLVEAYVAAGLAETQNACRECVSPIVTGRLRSTKQEAHRL